MPKPVAIGLVWDCDTSTVLSAPRLDPPELRLATAPAVASIRLHVDEFAWYEHAWDGTSVKLVAAFDPRKAMLYIAARKTPKRLQLAVDLRQELIEEHRARTFRVVG